MISQSRRRSFKPSERRQYGLARARDLAFDAVQELWRRRRAKGMKQLEIAERIGANPSWVCKKLRAPGNWTMETFGALVEGLDGEIEIRVHAIEDAPDVPKNYSAYDGYEPPKPPSPGSLPGQEIGGEPRPGIFEPRPEILPPMVSE